MISKEEAEILVTKKLEQIADELNNHVSREAYDRVRAAATKAASEILKAAGL